MTFYAHAERLTTDRRLNSSFIVTRGKEERTGPDTKSPQLMDLSSLGNKRANKDDERGIYVCLAAGVGILRKVKNI